MKRLLIIITLVIAGLNCQAQDDMAIQEQEQQDTIKFELDTLNAISIDQVVFDTLSYVNNERIKDTYEVYISLGLLMEYKINHRKATFDDFINWLVKYYNDEKKRIESKK